MTKKPKPAKIFDGIEDIGNDMLHAAKANNFKFEEGSPIAHAAAMTVSSATSLKRIADLIEKAFNMPPDNNTVAELVSLNITMRHIESLLERLQPPRDLQEAMEQQLKAQAAFFGEGPDGAGKIEEELDEGMKALASQTHSFGRDEEPVEKKSFWTRVLDVLAPYKETKR
jgi:hypothetical protein